MKSETPPSGAVTQQDVARHLGVSRAWVARALGGDPKITAHSRERVLAASRELGYDAHSNREARIMASRRNGQKVRYGAVGYAPLMRQPLEPYWMELQSGVHEALSAAGFQLMLLRTDSRHGWEKMDGLLVHSDGAGDLYHDLPVAIPFVSMMLPADGVSSVSPDEAGGIRQAVEHLVALGHRRIGYLIHHRKADAESISPLEQRRLAAYRDALEQAGIRPRNEWVGNLVDYGEFVLRGRRSMREWIEAGWAATGCTALLVQNDRAAIGAMEALHDAGYHVPDDVSVVGFDGTSECLLVRPHLTSVRANLHGIGVTAAELLLRQIGGDSNLTEAMVLPTQLEIRNSTGPPQAAKLSAD